ncbi:MAG: hypothetical protein JST38_19135 [Bacteroidetes bacterium]|nr:hypothetical protein [Bacteroidota bacterium]
MLAIPLAWLYRAVLRSSWALRIFAALLLWGLVRLNFGMIAHYDYVLYSMEATWPRILEVMGTIAAGN